jgi:hypothetical protein
MKSKQPTFATLTKWSDIGKTEHFVQFYDKDAILEAAVSGFFAGALSKGDAAIMIATERHRNAIEEQLRLAGFDVPTLQASGHYIPFDAANTLSRFMVDGLPDRNLFTATIGTMMMRAAQNGRHVRAFGEMVALLWAEGKRDAAMRLEDLWNELASTHSFALFCAYPLVEFRDGPSSMPFVHICKQHSRVISSETSPA